MATVVTFSSPDALESFLRGIAQPNVYTIANKGHLLTFVTEDNVVPGFSDISVIRIVGESALSNYLNNLSTKIIIITLVGTDYLIIQDNLSGPIGLPITVTSYSSSGAMQIGTGLPVTQGLYDETAGSVNSPDILLSWGGYYTKVESLPFQMLILQRGSFYTVIQPTPEP